MLSEHRAKNRPPVRRTKANIAALEIGGTINPRSSMSLAALCMRICGEIDLGR